jgi:hypothetical protein
MEMRTSKRGCLQTAMWRFMDLVAHYIRLMLVSEGKSKAEINVAEITSERVRIFSFRFRRVLEMLF